MEINIITGIYMEDVSLTSARHIWNQMRRMESIDKFATFHSTNIDVSDIIDYCTYYSFFFFFFSNVANKFCRKSLIPCAADAANCERIGTQSYGTTFEVVTFDLITIYSLFCSPVQFGQILRSRGNDWSML